MCTSPYIPLGKKPKFALRVTRTKADGTAGNSTFQVRRHGTSERATYINTTSHLEGPDGLTVLNLSLIGETIPSGHVVQVRSSYDYRPSPLDVGKLHFFTFIYVFFLSYATCLFCL